MGEPVGYEEYAGPTTPGSGTAYSLHGDRQGSIIAVTDQATGSVAARYSYDAFGERTQTVALTNQDYGFTGREFDPETGLYYYRARHYDPELGRFLQSDPLGFAAGDLNLYAYTWNDPANWSDPSGLSVAPDNAGLNAGVSGLGRAATKPVGRGAVCLGRKIGTFLASVAANLAAGRDITRGKIVSRPGCRTGFKAPKRCGCKGGLLGKALVFALSNSSFPTGTEVLTPEGPVAIETLREGDLVVARNEETGVSGVFPVTALMSRQALDVLWLTLEDGSGETTRMGVTSEHPLFAVGEGWTTAKELMPGDAVRDSALRELVVLAVEVDKTPQIVHNLEIADAHTYFAGELEAWGHNTNVNPFGGKKWYEIAEMLRGQGCKSTKKKTLDGVPSEWTAPNGAQFFLDDTGVHPNIGDHVDVIPPNCKRSGKFRLPIK